jgi:hypothetical protein
MGASGERKTRRSTSDLLLPQRAYHSARRPVFLLAAYAKNEKANLTRAERNAMKRLVPMLVAGYPPSD